MEKNILLVLVLALMMAAIGCDSEPKEKKPAGGRTALIGKWYEGDWAIYEFQADGSLVFDGNSIYTYAVKDNTVTASMRGIEMGKVTFSISGTGTSTTLKLSSSGSKGTNIWIPGTYTITPVNNN